MIRTMWNKILVLFGKKQIIDDKNLEENEKFVRDYEDIKDINFTAIFSNKLANYVVSDSNIDITGDNKRSIILQDVLKRLKKKLKKIISKKLGTGGILVIPYVARCKIYFNVITQNRLIINKKVGEDIVDCTILAEHIIRDQKNYYRWADYTLEDGNLYIKYRATIESSPISMEIIPEWGNIEDISITNVEKMPFMFIKSPIDNRRGNSDYGVPITYGCDKQISKIMKTLQQIDREFELKEVFIGADATLFKGEGALPKNGLYKKIDSGDDDFWEIFDPDFRGTPLFNKLMNECSMLEKQIGTSEGILTKAETQNATATEIRKIMKDTFDLCDDIRTELEDGLNDFLYACNVLADYYNLTPQGDYELKIDWSYALLEDTSQEFSHFLQGESRGVISKAELRQFIKPNETLEQAQVVIDEIKEQNPSTKDLLGE